jgi:hypothetical protein
MMPVGGIIGVYIFYTLACPIPLPLFAAFSLFEEENFEMMNL